MAALASNGRRRVVDAFTFYNEFEMLEFRFEELYDAVDFFVVCEATLTHSGQVKDLLFGAHLARYAKYLDKVVWVVDDDAPPLTGGPRDAWVREHHQREALLFGLRELGLDGGDVVLVTDCDEIPSAAVLEDLRRGDAGGGDAICGLSMNCYYYSFKWRWRDPWDHYPKAAPWSRVRELGPQALRMAWPAVRLADGGWHLSYFGNEAFVANKLRHFAHQEFNTTKDLAAVGDRMRTGKNLTDDQFEDATNDAFLPREKRLLEALLEAQGDAGVAGERAPPDAALVGRLRARIVTSEARPKPPRKKKFAVGGRKKPAP